MPPPIFRNLLHLNEGPWRWGAGVQAGIAMGLPIALFTLAGDQSWGFLASLGGFTALYGASQSRYERFRTLPLALVGFVVASGLGVLGAASEWWTSVVLIVVAALSCVLTLGMSLGPPGPTMFVLVAAISAYLATPSSHGSVDLGPGGIMTPALVAMGGLSAYFVIIAPLAVPSIRRRELAAAKASGECERRYWRIKFDSTAKAIAIRVIIAVAIASFFNRQLGAYRSYWVIITAVAILQSSETRRLTTIRALQRILGTILGVGIFALILMGKPTVAGMAAIVIFFQFATEVVVVRNYGLALIFITPLALTIHMAGAGRSGSPLIPVQGRIFDTLLGAGIALFVFWTGERLHRRLRSRRDGQIENS